MLQDHLKIWRISEYLIEVDLVLIEIGYSEQCLGQD